MGTRTLTETLMGEEATSEYATTLYDKTATACMFGYACSSGFGSGSGPKIGRIGGPNSPFGIIDRPDYLNGGTERFRKPEWDIHHGDHMNYEIKVPGIKEPLTNVHIPLIPFKW